MSFPTRDGIRFLRMVVHRGLPDGQEETERGQRKEGREKVAVETGYRNEQTGQNIDPSVLFKLHRNISDQARGFCVAWSR
jgi:hypothetical protein